MFLRTRGLAKSANGLKEDFFSIELWSKWAAVHLRQMICRFQWQWEERGRAHACDSSDTEIMTAHSRWRRRQGEGNGKMRTNRYLGHQQTTDLMVNEQYQVANFCFWNGLLLLRLSETYKRRGLPSAGITEPATSQPSQQPATNTNENESRKQLVHWILYELHLLTMCSFVDWNEGDPDVSDCLGHRCRTAAHQNRQAEHRDLWWWQLQAQVKFYSSLDLIPLKWGFVHSTKSSYTPQKNLKNPRIYFFEDFKSVHLIWEWTIPRFQCLNPFLFKNPRTPKKIRKK